MTEKTDYRGYHFLLSSAGKGWRVMIYAEGSRSAMPESPIELETFPKEEIVAEAKRIVDARLDEPK